MSRTAISLEEFNKRLSGAINLAPGLDRVWITAETSDLRVAGGHCYMELIDKHPTSGIPRAKCRAVIWASNYARLGARFAAETGGRLRSDIKIMACVSANFHPVHGLTLVINDIDTAYTLGELERRRMLILDQLRQDGVLECNRQLPWPATCLRVAVISASGAAGYGDFIKQLYHNPSRLAFTTTLFQAVMQGERTSASIIAAMESIMEQLDAFDCVVLIRGGGAVSDLASFDDYELAFNIAQFPLPVIVGIGHERDVTVLDYVANTRVKTPTAAAEFLIARMTAVLDRLKNLGADILRTVTDTVGAQHRQLAYSAARLPLLARAVIENNRHRTGTHLDQAITDAVHNAVRRQKDRLNAHEALLDTLSPEATLRRGFSITRIDGHAVTSATKLTPNSTIDTLFADGSSAASKITQINTKP